jgi:flagellar biogenesis protein FliO
LNAKKIDTLTEGSRSSGSNTLQMLFSVGSSLLIVLGLFLGVAWCYRRTLNTSLGGIPKQVVSVLGRTAIAPRQQLILVRFGSKLVLVSMNQGETRTLSEITDPIEVDQLAGTCESHQPHSLTNSFRSILNQSGGAV